MLCRFCGASRASAADGLAGWLAGAGWLWLWLWLARCAALRCCHPPGRFGGFWTKGTRPGAPRQGLDALVCCGNEAPQHCGHSLPATRLRTRRASGRARLLCCAVLRWPGQLGLDCGETHGQRQRARARARERQRVLYSEAGRCR